jgi:threonine synthase
MTVLPSRPFRWRCSRCARLFDADEVTYSCPACPGLAVLDMVPCYAEIGAGRPPESVIATDDSSMWRYGPLLPVPAEVGRRVKPDVGWTPLVPVPRLAARLGLRSLHVKDDARNPTGSLKDRASALVVARAVETDRTVVCTASSGNAAVALAGAAAAAGIRAVVFVPDTLPAAKLAQLTVHGAEVVRVAGGYERAVAACNQATADRGWYCRSTALNPYTAEGKKTAALEIAEQLGWQAPDVVLVPAGDGNIVSGVHRGFQDAHAMGWISRIPRIIAVQSAAAPALYAAWRSGATQVAPQPANTIADSINVAEPQDGFRALRAVRQTGGGVVVVEDSMLAEATAALAETAGLYVEPASGVTVAALPGLLESDLLTAQDRVVLVNTGHGLKDPSLAQRMDRPAHLLAPGGELGEVLDAVERNWDSPLDRPNVLADSAGQ